MLWRRPLHDERRGVARPRRPARRRRFAGCGPRRRRWRAGWSGSTRLRARGRTRGDRGDDVEEETTHRDCYACAAAGGALSAMLQHCLLSTALHERCVAIALAGRGDWFAPLRVFFRFESTQARPHSSIDLLCHREQSSEARIASAAGTYSWTAQPARRVASTAHRYAGAFAKARALAPLFCCRTCCCTLQPLAARPNA